MSFLGYIRLTRPHIPLIAGIAAAMGYWIIGGTNYLITLVLFLSTFFICAGGRALDDAFDAEYDALYHPRRPIPQKKASARGAGIFSAILLIVGFGISFVAGWGCALLAFINVLLVILHSTNLKRFPVLGNLILAYLVGTIFLYGGVATGAEYLYASGAIALIVFFEILAFEVIKDGVSVEEDKKTEGYSLGLYFGTRYSTIMALILVCIAIGLSYLPSVMLGIGYVIMISIVNVLMLIFAIHGITAKNEESLRKKKTKVHLGLCIILTIAVFVVEAIL